MCVQKRFLFLLAALAACALGLFLPGWWRLCALIPAVFCPLIPPPAAPSLRDEAWEVTRTNADHRTTPVVCIDETLLMGPPCYTAQACMPFVPVQPERFRAQRSAMLLSAAAALTAPLVDDALPDDALVALSIRPDNLRRQYPVLGRLSLSGAPGCIVRDGKGQRAFFISSEPSLIEACAAVFDGQERPLTQQERRAAAACPGLHFAYAPVADGKPGEPVYLGSIEPIRIEVPAAAALSAIDALRAEGFPVVYAGWGNYVRAAGLTLRAAQPGDQLRVRRVAGNRLDFDRAVLHYLRYEAMARRRRVWAIGSVAFAAVIAIPAGAFVGSLPHTSALPAAGFLLCAGLLAMLPALRVTLRR